MTKFVPADQQARERIERSPESLLVEAGAGTGKTTALVKRIVHRVACDEPGERIELANIAAITFTEKAAAELKARLRKALVSRADPLGDRAAAQIDTAAIGTIHAFAQRLLSQFPRESGLPPGFVVADSIESGVAFDDWWDRFLVQSLQNHREEWARALEAGLNERDVAAIALLLHRDWDRLEGAPFCVGTDPSLDPLLAQLQNLLEEAQPHPEKPDSLSKKLDALADWRRNLCGADRPLDVLRALKPFTVDRLGSRPNWGDRLDSIRRALGVIQDQVRIDEQAFAWAEVSPLIVHLAEAVLAYAAQRRIRGKIEFHDLLVLARNLLRDHHFVRRAVADRYRRVLVDEFQDTDPLQLEIVRWIASPNGTLERERLFFVGDPQQSIYRFRRADQRLYGEAKKLVDAVVPLTTNFRAKRVLVDWINARFESILCGYRTLDCPEPPGTVDGATVRFLEEPLQGVSARDVRRLEAEAIAKAILRAKRERWPLDGGRQTRFEDIAVLFPTRTILPELETALATRGIPYRIESASLVFETQEARDLLAILRAVEDPFDATSVVAALRTPAFACSDRQLAEYRANGGTWNYLEGWLPGMRYLKELHSDRQNEPVGTLVERIVRERYLMEIALAERRPRDCWGRLMMLVDRARAFDDSAGGTLRQFLRWAAQQAEHDASLNERIAPEEDDDAVRLMTIHAAKGLEFPVTVLAGIGSGERRSVGPQLEWSDDGRPAFRAGSKERGVVQTANAETVLQEERELLTAERDRLLYVAATRAKNHLVVSLYVPEKLEPEDDESFQPLAVRIRKTLDAYEPMEFSGEDDSPPIDDGEVTLLREPMDRDEWQRFRERALSAVPPSHRSLAVPCLGRRSTRGTAVERAIHGVLRSIDLTSSEGLHAASEAQAMIEGIPDLAHEVEDRARRIVESPSVRMAVAGEYWRDVAVVSEIDGITVDTCIDLLFRDHEGGFAAVSFVADGTNETEFRTRALEQALSTRLTAHFAIALGGSSSP